MQSYKNINQGGFVWSIIRTKFFCTSTSISTLLGINPYETRTSYLNRMIRKERKQFSEFAKAAMEHGVKTEKLAFDHLSAKIWHYSEGELYTQYSPGLFMWNEDPSIAASPDGLVIEKATGKIISCIEIKCPYSGSWWASKDPDQIFEKKPQFYIQMQVQMACVDCKQCEFFIYADGHEGTYTTWIEVKRDDEFIEYLHEEIQPWREIVEDPTKLEQVKGKGKCGRLERAKHLSVLASSVYESCSVIGD